MPAPAARMRSARVPIGTSSTSISPFRNCCSNASFSPTYAETTFAICLVWKSSPSPRSLVPTLELTTVSPPQARSRSAVIKFSGTPERPKPPTSSVAPAGTSATASLAEPTTLLLKGRCGLVCSRWSRQEERSSLHRIVGWLPSWPESQKNSCRPGWQWAVLPSLPWVVCFLSFFLPLIVLPSLPWVVCFISFFLVPLIVLPKSCSCRWGPSSSPISFGLRFFFVSFFLPLHWRTRGTAQAYSRGGKETGSEGPRHEKVRFGDAERARWLGKRDEAAKEAREARRRNGEDREPPATTGVVGAHTERQLRWK